ncbi:hypothetical protein CCC_03705 [Paramagnetospirillum magnetotacticum MS-1]|uniref:Uncharacterized protein n=1 Tax=Paramagnetospirillum magnetotacticum MS-1 TaxID=272627 RepID=A0A0C2UAB2_PARME|nr:hypothetical protein [Paramagnetospirillum magnetotacticum]KIL98422.1 hypothetical protein CCC_03705 [Paramagnetospirillum magnetotacticum MS-1]
MTIGTTLLNLFSDRSATETRRVEPRLSSVSTSAGTEEAGASGKPASPLAALPAPTAPEEPRFDLRNISPREFADVTHELYMEGTLNWDEFQMIGFPSELNPRYDETIGALTGELARPDHPKDMLGKWEQRVEFERRYNPDADQVRIAENALAKLNWQTQPPVKLSA